MSRHQVTLRLIYTLFGLCLLFGVSVGCGQPYDDPCQDISISGGGGATFRHEKCKKPCPTGQEICNGVCTDVQNDRTHCGGCGKVCPVGESCVKGSCTLLCPETYTICGTACVAPDGNRLHCKACNEACGPGQVCQKKQCVFSCALGLKECNGSCVDQQSDPYNCGACGTTCGQGKVCVDSKCQDSCSSTTTRCSGTCVSLKSDNQHCGACGNACQGGDTCIDGKCVLRCPSGFSLCNNVCIDTSRNSNHCGACGTSCKAGETCEQGQCKIVCGNGLTLCNGKCVDTTLDRAHCSACGNACPTGEVCSQSQCGVLCGGGTTLCGAQCVDTSIDTRHCGGCGKACPSQEICRNGTCALACPVGQVICNGKCVNKRSDRDNCGACGIGCQQNESCVGGVCRQCIGCPLWVKGMTGQNPNSNNDLTVGANGNIYSTGHFSGDLTLGAYNLRSVGAQDIFVTKQDPNGNFLWAKHAGGAGTNESHALTIGPQDKIYVTGAIQGIAGFDTLQATSKGGSDIYVGRLDANGNWKWVKSFGGTGHEIGRAIKADTKDNVYVSGEFSSPVTMGSTTLTPQGGADIILTRIDDKGAVTWSKSFGGTGRDAGKSIDVDSKENPILAGTFSGDMTVNQSKLTSKGGEDVFLIKMNDQGSILCSTQAGGANQDDVTDLSTDPQDNIYITGTFSGKATFGAITLTAEGGTDVFIAKLSPTCQWLWAKRFGGQKDDTSGKVVVDSKGDVITTGTYQGSAGFGTTRLNATGGPNDKDAFVVKMGSNGNVSQATNIGSNKNDQGKGVTVDPAGNVIVVGNAGGPTNFGGTPFSPSGSGNTYVAKYGGVPCNNNQTKCNGQCVDTQEDDDNCGACGNLCNSNQFCLNATCIQRPNCPQWANSTGGTSSEQNWRIHIDKQDNVLTTGFFFGTSSFGTDITSSIDGTDIFVAKKNKSGNHLWVATGGGTSFDGARGVSTAPDGSVYITGYFGGTANLGSTTLSSAGNSDVFIAKLSSGGQWQWAIKAGGSENDYGGCVTVDVQGNAYVTGYFRDTASFGTTTLTSKGGADIFVTKVDKNGNYVWAKQIGGSDDDYGGCIALDAQSNLYLTGNYSGTVNFPAKPQNVNLTSKGRGDIFIAKMDSNGNGLWALSAGGSDFDEGKDITVDGKDVYVIGYFQQSSTFGTTPLTSQGGTDIFVSKLSDQGQWVWTRAAGGTNNDQGWGIKSDGKGRLYLTGEFQGNATFGTLSLASVGNSDVFLVQMTPSTGNFVRIEKAGGTDADVGRSISIDSVGDVYVAGYFQSPQLNFTGGLNLKSSGKHDNFAFKCASFICPTPFQTCGGQCIDPRSSSAHCGGCNKACKTNERCVSSACTACTTPGEIGCGASCIDPKTNRDHCGGCNKKCSANAICSNSLCVDCSTNRTVCNNQCVDILTNTQHCGACGNTCQTGEICDAGTCKPPCVLGQKFCGSKCEEILTDNNNCGACGNVCRSNETCKNGKCEGCLPTELVCGGKCVDPQNDFRHCSTCNNACQSGQVCRLGSCYTQGSVTQTNTNGSGLNDEFGRDIAIDNKNNVYIVGHFKGSLTLGTTTITSKGGNDIFVAKRDQNGNYLWLRSAGDKNNELAVAITIDEKDNVYITGTKEGPLKFGSIPLNGTLPGSAFVAKLDSNGNWLWAKETSSMTTGNHRGTGIYYKNGIVYVTAQFRTEIAFGSFNDVPAGGEDVIVLTMSENGQWYGGVSLGGTRDDEVHDIVVDSKDNVYISGVFEGSIGDRGNKTVTAKGGTNDKDIYIAKISPNGLVVWLNRYGGSNSENYSKLAIDKNDNLYLTAAFSGTTEIGTFTHTSKGDADFFVARLDTNGAVQWSHAGGGALGEIPFGLATNSLGQVAVTGTFQDPFSFQNLTFSFRAGLDIFVILLDEKGQPLWSIAGNGLNDLQCAGLSFDRNDNIYLTGGMRGTATFGTKTLTASSSYDYFLLQFATPACRSSAKMCSGYCADLLTDSNHCGACGNVCNPRQYCQQGVCFSCASNQLNCNGKCIDVSNDPKNCGACGAQCNAGEFCDPNGGTPVCKSCPTGQELCNGRCIDTQKDANNCGGCGLPCKGTCSGGICQCTVGRATLATFPIITQDTYNYAFDARGNILYSVGSAGDLQVWNANQLPPTRMMSAQSSATGSTESVAYSEKHQQVFVASWNGIDVWDAAIIPPVKQFSLTDHNDRVIDLAIHGTKMASASWDKSIIIWDLSVISTLKLHTLTGHTAEVETVAFNPTGTILASGSRDKTVKLWDMKQSPPTLLHTLTGFTNEVRRVLFNRDGTLLATTDKEKIKLWDMTQSPPTLKHTLSGHTKEVMSLAFHPSNDLLASGDYAGQIKLWDLQKSPPQNIATLSVQGLSLVHALLYNKDGTHLYAGGGGVDHMRVWGCCDSGATLCSGQCKDLQSDPDTCGNCSTSCVAKQICTNGTCTGCPTATPISCYGKCVDTQADFNHCGACGSACQHGEICKLGKCEQQGNATNTSSSSGLVAENLRNATLDSKGNAILAGRFNGGFLAAPHTIGATGSSDIFVYKRDPQGKVLWSYSVGSGLDTFLYGLAVDKNDNIYITGTVSAQLTFGTTTLTPSSSSMTYVTKLDSNGNVIWATQSKGDPSKIEGKRLAVDASGNVYFIGFLNGTETFGTTTLSSSGAGSYVIAKLDSSGNWVWAKVQHDVEINDVAVDSAGNVYVVGAFTGTLKIGQNTYTSLGNFDAIIVKLDSTGKAQWVETGGGAGEDKINAIAIDKNDNIYLGGHFQSQASFNTINVAAVAGLDFFVAQMDTSGGWKWLTTPVGGNTADESVQDVSTDVNGNIYIIGNMTGDVSIFQPHTAVNGAENVFAAQVSPTGAFTWSRTGSHATSPIKDRFIGADGSGNIYLFGNYQGTATFGTQTFTAAGQVDHYVVSYSQPNCPNGQQSCAGVCTDTTNNRQHCGICGTTCANNETCINGGCVSCLSSEALCNGTCTDILSNNTHCGACGNACPSNQTCVQGVCQSCPTGQQLCSSACYILASSQQHCGACNNTCPQGSSCASGDCQCASGFGGSTALSGHSNTVNVLAVSRDNMWLLSASEDKTFRIWDISQTPPVAVGPAGATTDEPLSIAVSANKKYVFVGRKDGYVSVFDTSANNTEIKNFQVANQEPLTFVAFIKNDEQLLVGTSNENYYLFDVKKPQTPQAIGSYNRSHTDSTTAFALRPDRKFFATASLDKTVIIWDLSTNFQLKIAHRITNHTADVVGVAFSDDGSKIASVGEDKKAKVFTYNGTNAPTLTHDITLPLNPTAVTFRPGGKRILVTYDTHAEEWDISTATATKKRTIGVTSQGTIAAALYHPNQDVVWTGHNSKGQIMKWSCCTLSQTTCATSPGLCIDLQSSTSHCGACGTACKTGQLCTQGVCQCPSGTVLSGNKCSPIPDLCLDSSLLISILGRVSDIDFSSDDKVFVLAEYGDGGTQKGRLSAWDATKTPPVLIRSYDLNENNTPSTNPTITEFIPNTTKVLYCNPYEGLRIWDTQTGLTQQVNANNCADIDITKDGKYAAIARGRNGIDIIDLTQTPPTIAYGIPYSRLTEHKSVAFSPDGKMLASSERKATGTENVHIWSFTSTGSQLLYSLTAAAQTDVTGLAFSPDNLKLAAITNLSVTVWTLNASPPTATPAVKSNLNSTSGGTAYKSDVIFSPDGASIIIPGVEQWNVDVQAPYNKVLKHGAGSTVGRFAINSDGSKLLIGGDKKLALMTCCQSGQLACIAGSTCVDVSSNASTCGTCGTTCNTALGWNCVNGTCQCQNKCPTSCQSGETRCGTGCCKSGFSCVRGQCQCPIGTAFCSSVGQCLDIVNDDSNCGGCGNACTNPAFCSAGKCITCSTTETQCSVGNNARICTDLQTDKDHCGTCGFTCPHGDTCVDGACQYTTLEKIQVANSTAQLGTHIAVDSQGNLILIVGYSQTWTLTTPQRNAIISAKGQEDIALVKLDGSGGLIWAKSISGTGDDAANGLHVDAQDNIYVLQTNAGGNITVGTTNYNNTHKQILTKFNSLGNAVWSKAATATTISTHNGLHVDEAGNSYWAGYASGTYTIAGKSVTAASGAHETFVAKLDPTGKVLWLSNTTNHANKQARTRAVTVTTNGDVFVTGYFIGLGTYNFGTKLASVGINNPQKLFVAKIDSSGAWQWVRSTSGTGTYTAIPNSIVADTAGFIHLSGYVSDGLVRFGSSGITSSAGAKQVFVAQMDSTGSWLSALDLGRIYTGQDNLLLHVDTQGNRFVLLSLNSNSITVQGKTYSTNGAIDTLVVKINQQSSIEWVQQTKGSGTEHPLGMALSRNALYVTGRANGSISLYGPPQAPTLTLDDDYFIWKLPTTCPNAGKFCGTNGCKDVQNDKNNCGDCGNTCSSTQSCFTSSCVAPITHAQDITNNQTATHIAVDPSGHVYTLGYYTNAFSVVTQQGTINFSTYGGTDLFVFKYDRSNNIVHAFSPSGTATDQPRGLGVDKRGNLYILQENLGGTVNLPGKTYTPSDKIIISKYDPNGGYLWSQAINGTNVSSGGLHVDEEGNVFVNAAASGAFSVASSSRTTAAGAWEVFVAKFDTSGNLQWVSQSSNHANRLAGSFAITTDASGNVYTTGELITAGSYTFGTHTIGHTNGKDVFVAKLNASGQWQWARATSNTSNAIVQPYSIKVDSSGKIHLAGYFRIGSFQAGTLTVNKSTGTDDLFLLTLDKAGSWKTAKRLGKDIANPTFVRMDIDPSGNRYISTVGGNSPKTEINGIPLTPTGNNNAIVIKVDTSDNVEWVARSKGTSAEQALNILYKNQALYLVGQFFGVGNFGGTSFRSNAYDMFIWQIPLSCPSKQFYCAATGCADLSSDKNNCGSCGTACGATQYCGAGTCTTPIINNVNAADTQIGEHIAVDKQGNVYVLGNYYNTLTLTTTGGPVTLSAGGGADLALLKLNASGDVVWARSLSGTNHDHPRGLMVDGVGNIYTLQYNDNGNVTLASTPFNSNHKLIVAKFDTLGNPTWAKSTVGGTFYTDKNALHVDTQGNVYFTGYAGGTFNVAGSPAITTASNALETFVTKLNTNGVHQWTARSSNHATLQARGHALTTDSGGNVYVLGYLNNTGTYTFGTVSATVTTNGRPMFVGKLNSTGTWQWVRLSSDTANVIVYPFKIAIDSNNVMHTTGYATGDFSVGTYAINKKTLNNRIFLASIDSTGKWLSGINVGDVNSLVGTNLNRVSMAVSPNGDRYINTTVQNAKPVTLGTTPYTSADIDVFVIKVNASGSIEYVRNSSGTGQEVVNNITFANGNVFITGSLNGAGTLGGTNLTSNGSDVLVWQLAP